MDIVNLYDKYNLYFDNNVKAIFEIFSKIACENNFKIYLIGGIVRDFLLNKDSLDIDITVEGNAIKFAEILQQQNIAEIKSTHENFATAKIIINNFCIDLASTRSEHYPIKGQLPVIKEIGCSLKEDIIRRDFTVNSLALSLNKENFLEIIDYVQGIKDLNNKIIKVLHENSFVDDPTRIIRALKYSERLNFKLDEHTNFLIQNYLNNIDYNMGYKRILQEFEKTFSEKNPPYKKFITENIYKLINPNKVELYNTHKQDFNWIVYFGLIAPENLEKFNLNKNNFHILNSAKCLENKTFSTNLEIYKAFCALPEEAIQILTLKGNIYAKKYDEELKTVKVLISGKDLLELGLKPSKSFSKIFDYILEEKLKNPKLKKSEEVTLAKNFINIA